LKILHICQYYNEGWGYQENLLPRYQKKLGHDVVVITSDRRPFYVNDKNPRVVGTGTFYDNGVRIERISIKWEFKNRFVVFRDLMDVLEKEKPDYIFHHGLTSPSLITAAKYKRRHLNVFLAADSHSDFANSGNLFLSRKIYHGILWKEIIKRHLNFIDRIFAVAPWCIEFEKSVHAIPENKLSLLPLGCDTENSHFDEKSRVEIREKYHISSDDFLVVTAGKIDALKRTNLLVKAVKHIKLEKLKLMIIGTIDKHYFAGLNELVNSDPRIIFTGWVKRNELYKYFSAADIGIWPGGQSAIWQEAISCSLPIIIKHWPYVEYIVENGNGLVLYSDDYREIKQYIEILANSPEVLEKMRKETYLFSQNYLSYSKIAEESILLP
jgi:glycosyltransferase involved in cell wall biosynthesis